MADTNTPQPHDVAGEYWYYDIFMTRVYSADAELEEHSAPQQLLFDMKMEKVGEAADWSILLAGDPNTCPNMVLVDYDMLPSGPIVALGEVRKVCSAARVNVLTSRLDARHQTARTCLRRCVYR